MVDVSVITNTYNDGQYLSRAIHSVACQTYGNLEHLIVDDGSTDDTQAILGLYDYDHLRIIRKPENEGLARARNTGLEYADGAYVVYLDADDELLPQAIETLVTLIEATEAIAVCPSYFHIWDDGTTGVQSSPNRQLTDGDFENHGMSAIGGFGGTMIEQRALDEIGGFDTQFNHTVDFDLCLRLITHGPMYGTDEILYTYYRGHESQMSSQDHLADRKLFLDRHNSRMSRYYRSNCYYGLALDHGDNGDVPSAKQNLLKAIVAYPARIQYYYYLLAIYLGGYDVARHLHNTIRDRVATG
ncbi:glycosyltransferase family 2 protein [Natronobeatus ordinarius]|uniref:glycosyltransferase family 2 protein n=1 Tax=Natronobeatus ordinarius TaxID=2963433 RepID=UPI0020CDFF0B|nr:glycosyltransferase family 2 protein [Natronobeatus ordinarius]